MAHSYDPKVQYPNHGFNGYVRQQQSQSPAAYPIVQGPDPRVALQYAQHPYAAFQQSSPDGYQASRAQTAASQINPSLITQSSPGFVHQQQSAVSAAEAQTSRPITAQYPQYQSPVSSRPATAFSQIRASDNSAQYPPPPASPTRASQLRRPLPQRPGDIARSTTPSRHTPEANRAPLNAPSLHRPSYSVDGTRTYAPSAFPGSSFASPGGVSSQLQTPRPLPEPIPRSTRSLDLTRSPSPSKQVLETASPLSQPGQKFVPLWKRALPTPIQTATSPPTDKRNTISSPPAGFDLNVRAQPLQRSKTAAVRPLPPSPGRTQTLSTPQPSASKSAFARTTSEGSSSPPQGANGFTLRDRTRTLPDAPPPPQSALPHRPDSMLPSPRAPAMSTTANVLRAPVAESPISSDSEDMYDNSLLRRPGGSAQPAANPSPTYGIRDLPSRLNRSTDNTPNLEQESRQRSAFTDNSSAKPQAGGPRSMASRIAALTLTKPPQSQLDRSPPKLTDSPPKPAHPMPAMERASTQDSDSRWPSNLPPLPRAPLSSGQTSPQRSPVSRFAEASPAMVRASSQPAQQTQLSGISPPTQSQLPRPPQRDTSPSRPLPSAPGNATTSRQFPSLRHPSPIRSQPTPPRLPAAPREPSPTRYQVSAQSSSGEPRGRVFPQSGIPNLDDAPPPSLRRTPSPVRRSTFSSSGYNLPNIRTNDVGRMPHTPIQITPSVMTPSSAGSSFSLSAFPSPPHNQPSDWNGSPSQSYGRRAIPNISFSANPSDASNDQGWVAGPSIAVSGPDEQQGAVPQISFAGSDDDNAARGPRITVGNTNGGRPNIPEFDSKRYYQLRPVVEVDDYPPCLGCGALIIGDAVNAMGGRWHPRCYRCSVCHESLEMLAPIEHEGKLYCTVDYHEKFSPRCYHCDTVIADPSYITLNDKELGTRTYHDQHFFCSECGDPFVTPGMKNRTFDGDGPFEGGEVGMGFTVFRGFPYCAKCHAKLRWPKCKKCKKGMAPDSDIIEALGAKWCADCFVCTSCQSPFRNGRLFMRDNKPFCQDCFEIMIKSEF